MKPNQFIMKIRTYSFFSFILPLITINLCLLLYILLGNIETYSQFNWNQKIIKSSVENYIQIKNNKEARSFTNCPKSESTTYVITHDNQKIERYVENESANDLDVTIEEREAYQLKVIKYSNYISNLIKNNKVKYITIEQSDIINKKCIKNYKISYFLLTSFNKLENILITGKKEKSGFAIVKNPYLHGEVSISRTARYFPATLIFKPLLILSAIFLILYWKNNLALFSEFKNKNILNNFSNLFFYFGIISSVFLILHASFLGLDIDSKLFSKIRKIIIISFIFFEVLAQFYMTKNLFNFKSKLKNYLNYAVLNLKIVFISTVLVITVMIFFILVFGDLNSSTKHILEWNYFSILLIYYLLSSLLWKSS